MQFIGDGENNVEILRVQEAGLLFCQPTFNLGKSTKWAHAVFARVIPVSFEVAVRAGLDVTTQNRRAANRKAVRRLANVFRKTMRLIIEGIAKQKNRLNRCFHYDFPHFY